MCRRTSSLATHCGKSKTDCQLPCLAFSTFDPKINYWKSRDILLSYQAEFMIEFVITEPVFHLKVHDVRLNSLIRDFLP
jgi:hypothetical protein